MLTVNNLYKSFSSAEVIKNLSFKIEKTGITVITGKSGCGKSTLLSIILGLIKADSGEIIRKTDKISAMFQEDRLLENKNGVENIMFVGADESESRALLEKLGLGDSLNVAAKELSGGMRRRVAFARAIITKPDLLLLDEPLNALDKETASSLARYIEEYAKDHAVLMVTHRPEAVSYIQKIEL